MEIKYTIKGVTLDELDMQRIKEYYTAHCIAEYLMENYALSEDDAVSCGYQVYDLMLHKDYTEEDAIDEVLKNELPTELFVNCYDIDAEWYDLEEQEQEEAVSDYLSDTYGFCHYGFRYEAEGETIHITHIEWDEEE